MTTRRDFIKGSSIVLAGSLFKADTFQFLAKTSSVIIIGAGFAGLAAAAQLKKRKIKLTVLEARNRVGGRVYSFNVSDENLVVELGAEWVGKSHERLIELCDEFKLELQNNQFESHLVYKGKYHGKG